MFCRFIRVSRIKCNVGMEGFVGFISRGYVLSEEFFFFSIFWVCGTFVIGVFFGGW